MPSPEGFLRSGTARGHPIASTMLHSAVGAFSPGVACIVIANDVSGSMAPNAQARQESQVALFSFARRNLRADDLIVLLTWDSKAVVAMPATRVAELPSGRVPEPIPGGGGSDIAPAVAEAGKQLDGLPCAARGLLSVTDFQIATDPRQLHTLLADTDIQRTTLLIPGGSGRPGPSNDPALSELTVDHFRSGDADRLGLQFGELAAQLTGQQLTHR